MKMATFKRECHYRMSRALLKMQGSIVLALVRLHFVLQERKKGCSFSKAFSEWTDWIVETLSGWQEPIIKQPCCASHCWRWVDEAHYITLYYSYIVLCYSWDIIWLARADYNSLVLPTVGVGWSKRIKRPLGAAPKRLHFVLQERKKRIWAIKQNWLNIVETLSGW